MGQESSTITIARATNALDLALSAMPKSDTPCIDVYAKQPIEEVKRTKGIKIITFLYIYQQVSHKYGAQSRFKAACDLFSSKKSTLSHPWIIDTRDFVAYMSSDLSANHIASQGVLGLVIIMHKKSLPMRKLHEEILSLRPLQRDMLIRNIMLCLHSLLLCEEVPTKDESPSKKDWIIQTLIESEIWSKIFLHSSFAESVATICPQFVDIFRNVAANYHFFYYDTRKNQRFELMESHLFDIINKSAMFHSSKNSPNKN
jgi:hypothetical protein